MRAIRPTSSLRTSASIGAGSFSSRSRSCSTMTSSALVNNRWLEGIVAAIRGVRLRSQQLAEIQKGVLVQQHLLDDLHLAGVR